MIKLELQPDGPLYLRLSEALKTAILAGRIGPDEQLPTEAELAEQQRVHRLTVRRAYQRLKENGIIYQQRGRGTFVCSGIAERLGQKVRRRIRTLLWITYQGVAAPYEFIQTDLFAGIAETCAANEIELRWVPLAPDGDRLPESLPGQLAEADGAIYFSNHLAGPLEALLEEHDTPAVALWNPFLVHGRPLITYDRVAAGRLAGEHLLDAGLQRLVFVGTSHRPGGQLKLRGFADAIQARGLTIEADLTTPSNHYPGKTFSIFRRHLGSTSRPPEGVFAASDYQALEVLHALTEFGLRVPEDVALVGYDDAAGLADRVGLTSIRTPRQRIGHTAVQTLLDWSVSEPTLSTVILQPELIVRRTSRARTISQPAAGSFIFDVET